MMDFNRFSIWPPFDAGKTSMKRYRKEKSGKPSRKKKTKHAFEFLVCLFVCPFVLYVFAPKIKNNIVTVSQ